MDKVRTLSDTKREFYVHHTRPVNSIFRRVVEELMVEMHLLKVSVDFRYDPIYALGVVTAYDRFLEAYRPEKDRDTIFAALCRSIGDDPHQYRQDAERLQGVAQSLSGEEMINVLTTQAPVDGAEDLPGIVSAIANYDKFKYSRLFAIGLYTLLEKSDPEKVKGETKRQATLKLISDPLKLPLEKMEKDLDLYQTNLEKMEQARSAIEDALKASRKQREKRAAISLEKEITPELEDKASPSQES